jgi:hypothetical protein
MAVLVLVPEELVRHAVGYDRPGGLNLRGENSATDHDVQNVFGVDRIAGTDRLQRI